MTEVNKHFALLTAHKLGLSEGNVEQILTHYFELEDADKKQRRQEKQAKEEQQSKERAEQEAASRRPRR